MRKLSFNEWFFEFVENWGKEIVFIMKFFFGLLLFGYIVFFVRLGFDFSDDKVTYGFFGTIFIGLLLVIFGLILFYLYHLSTARSFGLTEFGFFLSLAVGGTLIGLIGGLAKSFFGWVIGGIIGISVIALTLRYYLKRSKRGIDEKNKWGGSN